MWMISTLTRSKLHVRVAQTTCGLHDHAPAALKAHLEIIRRHEDYFSLNQQNGLDPNRSLDRLQAASEFCVAKYDVSALIENCARITGIEKDDVLELLQHGNFDCSRNHIDKLESWKHIENPESLFLKGLGKFDVATVTRSLITAQRNEFAHSLLTTFRISYLCKEGRKVLGVSLQSKYEEEVQSELSALLDLDLVEMCKSGIRKGNLEPLRTQDIFSGTIGGRPFWFVEPLEIQAIGYFGNAGTRNIPFVVKLLAEPQCSPMRQHLLQYRDHWNDKRELQKLKGVTLDSEFESSWSELGDGELPPPDKLLETLQRRNPQRFEFLDSLEDANRFRVLRTLGEMREAGNELCNNCLRDGYYDQAVKRKEDVFVCLDNDNGTAIAVRQYWLRMSDWGDIRLKCNHSPSNQVESLFDLYASNTIRPWADQMKLASSLESGPLSSTNL